jgi:hypothetical protein
MLLATSEPYSVVLPYRRSASISILYEPEDVYSGHHVWWGVRCRFVRIYIGLPVLEPPTPRPFVLRALLPLRDVEDTVPFLRLGCNFLTDYGARVELQSAPASGHLLIP